MRLSWRSAGPGHPWAADRCGEPRGPLAARVPDRRGPGRRCRIEQLRKGDILVVTRHDRLARSTSELLRIAERLTDKNAGLQSLDEPWADTTRPCGRMVMTIFAGIAAFERTLIISRTKDGRPAAKARGVAFGRPKKMRLDQRELAKELVRDGKTISAVARTCNVHPATIDRVIEGQGAYATFLFLLTAPASTVQWLLHRRMNAQQHMRWSPWGAHLGRSFDAQGPNLGRERDVRARPCRRRAMDLPSVPASGLSPTGFWTVSGKISRLCGVGGAGSIGHR